MAADPLIIRVKNNNGTLYLEFNNKKATLGDLCTRISLITGISEADLRLYTGYPPMELDLTYRREKLTALDINSGDTLIVDDKNNLRKFTRVQVDTREEFIREIISDIIPRESSLYTESVPNLMLRASRAFTHLSPKSSDIAHKETTLSSEDDAAIIPSICCDSFARELSVKTVPGDNSCLFSSFKFILKGCLENTDSAALRRLVAEELEADPERYNEGVLGQPLEEYQHWIQQPENWGGAIELSILSHHYNIEIAVVNTESGIINRFGEDRNLERRCFLMYDGSHYDALSVPMGAGKLSTIFPTHGSLDVYEQAKALAKLFEKPQKRQNGNLD